MKQTCLTVDPGWVTPLMITGSCSCEQGIYLSLEVTHTLNSSSLGLLTRCVDVLRSELFAESPRSSPKSLLMDRLVDGWKHEAYL